MLAGNHAASKAFEGQAKLISRPEKTWLRDQSPPRENSRLNDNFTV